MSEVRPRTLVHGGVVEAVGVVVDRGLGEARARRRVLECWRAGAEVHRAPDAYVVWWPGRSRMACERAGGAPLVAIRSVPCAAPLTLPELDALAPPPGAVVLVRAGRAYPHPLGADTRVAVHEWIDVAPFEQLRPLRGAGAEEVAPLEIAAAPERDARAVLGAPRTDGDAARVHTALARAGEDGAVAEATRSARPGLLSRLMARLSDRRSSASVARSTGPGPMARLLARLLPRSETSRALPGRSSAAPPRAPGVLARLRQRLTRVLLRTRLAERIGRRQAEYLQHMLALFDRGELDEALRHAIPLGGEEGSGLPSLSTPEPRDRLEIPLERERAGGSSLHVVDEAIELIRDRYRAALAQLEAQGRLEEAAFVLCELLGDPEGAITLLERHGDLTLAARLAESRDLPPGLQVRLWLMAGDRERAVLIARRTGAFADAIARLDRRDPDRAAELRRTWAEILAMAGDHAAAVDVLWPLVQEHEPVVGWMERAVRAGGRAGARMLVRLIAVRPDRFGELCHEVEALCADRAEEGFAVRVELARALVRLDRQSEETRALARLAARTVIRDIGLGLNGDAASLVGRLLRIADDPALRADRPPLPAPSGPAILVDRERPAVHRIARADAGNVPVRDVAALPDGRLLVALGELGVRIVARDGRTVTHFEQPADRLVVSDAGTRAIAVAHRGTRRRLARIDLVGRRAGWWYDTELDVVTDSFDGERWFVAGDSDIVCLDACAERHRALWGVDAGARVEELARDRDGFAALASARLPGAGGPPLAREVWRYQLPSLRLIERKPVPSSVPDDRLPVAAALVTDGRLFWLEEELEPGGERADGVPVYRATGRQVVTGYDDELTLPPVDARSGALRELVRGSTLVARPRWCASSRPTSSGARVDVLHARTRRVIATVELEGAGAVSIRFGDLELLVCDDRGRALALELRYGTLRRDHRVFA